MAANGRAEHIDVAAAAIGLTIPAACRDGVEANLALFLQHAAIVAEADDDPLREPAELFRP